MYSIQRTNYSQDNYLEFELLIDKYKDIDNKYISMFYDNQYHDVIISTNKLDITYDKNYSYNNNIKSLNNVTMTYKTQEHKTITFKGNLQCSFNKNNPGGMFFIKKVFETNNDFEKIKGVKIRIKFALSGYKVTDINSMYDKLKELSNNPNFVYNISQFDEFIEIFNFYKTLSNELNNNYSFNIIEQSKPFFFITSEVKEFNTDFKEEITDQNNILIGYRFNQNTYEQLKNEIKNKAKKIITLNIKADIKDLKKIIKYQNDNLYLSNYFNINEQNAKALTPLNLINIKQINNNEIILYVELKKDSDYKNNYNYLNIYNMGQKIKIDSIENSLKLINQGSTNSSIELLEYLIGDAKMPTKSNFNKYVDNEYTKNLNEKQKEAFYMAIDGSPISLIKGPPGTGKTHVINAITQYITKELHEKVIISSQTHVAIDNVLDKLMQNFDLVIPKRISNRKNKYDIENIDETLYETWGTKFLEHNNRSTNNKVKEFMQTNISKFKGEYKFDYAKNKNNNDYCVIGATTTTTAISGKKGNEILDGYNWLIIDEVSKCPITEVLRYLPYVEHIIMVGDNYQLPPLLEFNQDDVKDLKSFDKDKFEKLKTIYEQSVFAKVLKKAEEANRLVVLNDNYRSVKNILPAYNVFYEGALNSKRDSSNKIHFKTDENKNIYENNDVIFVEVKGGKETIEGTSRFNVEELNAMSLILKDLVQLAIEPQKMTVSAIFPYSAQIQHFEKENVKLINEAKKLFKSFEINTVDAFQGKESDVVLVSTVVTDSSRINFLNDFRRINVAMSRAKDKLIIFGNSITLTKINMITPDGNLKNYFSNIIENIKNPCGQIIEYKEGNLI